MLPSQDAAGGGPPEGGQARGRVDTASDEAMRAAATSSRLGRQIAALAKKPRRELVAECQSLGLPGNINERNAVLQDRLAAHFVAQAGGICPTRPSAVGDSRSAGRAAAILERVSQGLRGGFPGPSASRSTAVVPVDRPTSSAAAPPSKRPAATDSASSEDRSPSPPRGKRPRPEAPPFCPSGAHSDDHPLPDARAARRPPPVFLEPMAARRRSHALASIRPTRLDESLAIHAELRRLNVCLRGLADSASETPAEVLEVVEGALERMVGEAVLPADAYRVGRFQPDRPRPIIIRFNRIDDKIRVLRGKGMLYGDQCPSELAGVRVYHDLSPGQMDWKRKLVESFNFFLSKGIRAVWRMGYRLFALVEGSWVEYYPEFFLV